MKNIKCPAQSKIIGLATMSSPCICPITMTPNCVRRVVPIFALKYSPFRGYIHFPDRFRLWMLLSLRRTDVCLLWRERCGVIPGRASRYGALLSALSLFGRNCESKRSIQIWAASCEWRCSRGQDRLFCAKQTEAAISANPVKIENILLLFICASSTR